MGDNQMSDEQFKKLAEFEDSQDVTVISPNLMQQMKPKQNFFYVVFQDQEGRIQDIKHYDDYNVALMRGMDQAKDTGTSWSIFALNGKFVDGNFNSK